MMINAATLTRGTMALLQALLMKDYMITGHRLLTLTKPSDQSLPTTFLAFDAIDRIVQMASTWQDVGDQSVTRWDQSE